MQRQKFHFDDEREAKKKQEANSILCRQWFPHKTFIPKTCLLVSETTNFSLHLDFIG
jgi:hypothetical protein